MKRPLVTYTILFLLLGLPIVWLIVNKMSEHKISRLPILGERSVNENGDTVYYRVPAFIFTNQDGQTVTDKDYDSSIYVANFFYATCPDICPKMNTNLSMVYNYFRHTPGVRFISHTVDPLHDSVHVLKEYAQKLKAEAPRWNFVTGPESSIFRAGQGYLLPVSREDSVIDHSQRLILVDRDKRIRGEFDGLNYAEVQKLNDAIKALLIEYNINYKPD